ncbi:MAG: hypothetical protein ACTSWW_07310 [Promethearchaeota archaeon]
MSLIWSATVENSTLHLNPPMPIGFQARLCFCGGKNREGHSFTACFSGKLNGLRSQQARVKSKVEVTQ